MNAYSSTFSFILTLSERIPEKRMSLFQEIQEKWNVKTWIHIIFLILIHLFYAEWSFQ